MENICKSTSKANLQNSNKLYNCLSESVFHLKTTSYFESLLLTIFVKRILGIFVSLIVCFKHTYLLL